MSEPEFAHLHVHTQYSMLDGAVKVKDLVKRVAAAKMKSVAVTDHGNMFGAVTFYKAAKDAGVQAILGCEIEVVDPSAGAAKSRHLPLLASSLEGYKNLVWLVSRGHVAPDPSGPAGIPCVSLEDVAAHAKGLIAMTGCMGGLAAQKVLEEGGNAGLQTMARLKEIFEPGSLYVELQDHGLVEQPVLNEILVENAKKLGLPLVATNDVHYAAKEDAEAHLYLSCIKNARSYVDAKERHHGSHEMYLKSPAEMHALFAARPEAIKNTLAIAERCQVKLKLGEPMLPSFDVPEGYDTESYFRHVAKEGLERRFEEIAAAGGKAAAAVNRDAYRARLAMELDVIAGMKFPGYFLIVWDFIRYAKENGIPVGPGRGSGAGSIVAYAMRITDLDPIPYNLLFERFLNPERVSMPDFDVDFCMDRRDQVIAYVQKKYGEESVGQIATFAELKAKSVIKDVARSMGITPIEAQQIANLIPQKTPAETYTISESIEVEPKLKARMQTEPVIAELLKQSMKLEGLTRHAGKHAAGIVISEGPLWDHVPCFKDEKTGAFVTQYYKDDVEAAGLVKFDFLGLKTLTVLDIAVRLINARPDHQAKGGQPKKVFDLSKIPMDDKLAFALLGSGETKGVFQLESSGMQQLFKDLKADCFEDIVAAVALYRPGPLGAGMVTNFVNRKNGREPIGKMHDLVDELLKPTYGVVVYQEQVMQVAQMLAGYSLGGADLLRRAMGKKKPEEMAKQKTIFVEGATAKGVTQEDAERIFALLEFFAGYGFNKCVIGATEIVDATTGERTTVGDLYARRRPFTVHALGEDGKLRPRPVTDVMRNGRKRVFELRTAQGKRIVATANHPFRTLDGWTNLGDLRVGDRIAAPRRLPTATKERWPRHEVIALAGLLSEGNTCHPTSVIPRCAPDPSLRPGMVPWNAGSIDGNSALAIVAPEPARSGMFSFVPDAVFRLADEDLEVFVGRLWASDGFFANATQAVPFYATSSEQLARDVQTLLLRLGIPSGVHAKPFQYRGTERPGYTVDVIGEAAIETFLVRVAPHAVGCEAAVALLQRHVSDTLRERASKGAIAADVRRWVDEETSDVFWDCVVTIEPRGLEETFDLTVDVDHNFVADGLVVHNSHSAAYALITYQTAYLKAHYPVELLCGIMTSDKDRIEKVVRTIADARSMGVTVLPPDVNESDTDFKVVYTHPDGDRKVGRNERVKDPLGPQVRFGLGAVRGVGGGALDTFFEARASGGAFVDLFDFGARVDAKRINKSVLEALVQCGAFDATFAKQGITRARAFASIDVALERSRAASRDRERGQTSLFGLFDAGSGPSTSLSQGDYAQSETWDRREMLVRERQSLGFYVSGHPLERYLRGPGALVRLDAIECSACAGMQDWAVVRLAGMVEGYREKVLRDNGGKLAFFELEDLSGRVNVKVRGREIDGFAHLLTSGEPVLIAGKVSFPRKDDDAPEDPEEGERVPTIFLNEVRSLSQVIAAETKVLTVRLHADRTKVTDLKRMKDLFIARRGECPVTVHLTLADGAEAMLSLGKDFKVEVGDPLLAGLERVFGEQVAELRN